MEVQLTIQQPDGVTTQHRFDEEPITIGSAIANHIVYEDPQLAPHQLIIFRERGNWVIRNLAKGVDLISNHEFVEPGTTVPLPVQASIQMGSYNIEWYSEAPPQDAACEFGRSAEAADTVTRGRVNRGAEAPAPQGAQSELPPLRSPRKRTEAAGTTDGSAVSGPAIVRPVGGLEAEPTIPAPADQAPPLEPRDVDPNDIESMRQAIANVIEAPHEEEMDAMQELAPEAPTGGDVATEASPPDSRPAPRRTAADPFALDPAPAPSQGDERVGVVGYRVMNPARTYPFQVNVHAKSGCGGIVRVVPSFPGCSVTPTSARIDASRGQGGIKFWVTPIAVGTHDDAFMDMAWQGSQPVRLKIPCRVASFDASKLWAFVGAMCAVVAILVYRGRWKVMDQLERALPAEYYAKVSHYVAELGGPVNCFLLFGVVFMIGALVAIWLRRPRKLRLAAKRP